MLKNLKLQAFTVIELLVVVLIMVLLFAVAANSFYNIRQQRRDMMRIGDINSITTALEEYKIVEGNYPLMLTPGEPLVGEKSGIVFMDAVPENREYKRVDCLYPDYYYEYNSEDKSYIIDFCFESNLEGYEIGDKCFVNGDIVENFCSFVCGDILVDSRDSEQYETVQIGDQCWMAENLKYLPEVYPSAEGSETIPYYYVYNYQGYDVEVAKASTNYNIYGVLYNWPAAMAGDVSDGTQGICPVGWYLPTDQDWKILEGTVDSVYGVGDPIWNNTDWRGSDVAIKLKKSSWGGDDAFGFTALPGGYRHIYGSFNYINSYAFFWPSSASSSNILLRALLSSHSTVRRNSMNLAYGFSLRCLKAD